MYMLRQYGIWLQLVYRALGKWVLLTCPLYLSGSTKLTPSLLLVYVFVTQPQLLYHQYCMSL